MWEIQAITGTNGSACGSERRCQKYRLACPLARTPGWVAAYTFASVCLSSSIPSPHAVKQVRAQRISSPWARNGCSLRKANGEKTMMIDGVHFVMPRFAKGSSIMTNCWRLHIAFEASQFRLMIRYVLWQWTDGRSPGFHRRRNLRCRASRRVFHLHRHSQPGGLCIRVLTAGCPGCNCVAAVSHPSPWNLMNRFNKPRCCRRCDVWSICWWTWETSSILT